MFYAHIVLAKKGPLAKIWLAAHWDKKLTKAHVFETNIEQSVDGIMQPKVKLALRTSGHLLLGVVRIYSRKAKYLLADCNEAFVKIKMAFRPGMVDLPEGHREANVNAITLPEVFHDFDTALPELNDIDIEAQFSVIQSRADEITMREDYGSLSMSLHDDGFGDMGFDGDTPDIIRAGMDPNVDEQLFEKELGADVGELKTANMRELSDVALTSSRLDGDGFGDEFGQPELFEGDLFGEPPLTVDKDKETTLQPANEYSDEEGVDQFDTGAPSPIASSSLSDVGPEEGDKTITEMYDDRPENAAEEAIASTSLAAGHKPDEPILNQAAEDEGFALTPVEASAYRGAAKPKRKRKLIVDEVKNISGEEMKAQLANTADIVTTLDLAPPTKRWLMFWKETGGVEKLFALPTRPIPARTLFINYQRHLISHFSPLEDFSALGPADVLALDQIHPENESPATHKRGRKRKQDVQPIIPNTHEVAAAAAAAAAAASTTTTKSLAADISAQSLPAPDSVREAEDRAAITQSSLDLGISGDALTPHATSSIFDQAPMTPHHPTIEAIESIPNLPADQVSSILNEAENMPDNIDYNVNIPCDIATDWNDYDFPPSVHMISDEQMENETDEQFEERVLNKRAAQMFYAVKNRIKKQEFLLLSELTFRNTKKQAAQKFYSLLVLKKFHALNISQSEPYSEIYITRGPSFENPKL